MKKKRVSLDIPPISKYRNIGIFTVVPDKRTGRRPRLISIGRLRSAQLGVDGSRVRHYIDNPTCVPILVLQIDTELVIRDGYHRAVAAINRGDRMITARVFRLTPSQWKEIQRRTGETAGGTICCATTESGMTTKRLSGPLC